MAVIQPKRILTVIVSLLSCSLVSAAIPGADNPQAYTQQNYLNDLLAYNQRTTVEAYKQVGQKNPKWDAPATALLEGIARHLVRAQETIINTLPGAPALPELEKLGAQAIAAGCDDPLVLDMYSITLADQQKTAEMIPYVRKAADGLMNGHYSSFRAAGATRRALKTTTARDVDLKKRYDDQLYNLDIASVKEAEKLGFDRRIYLLVLATDLSDWPIERQKSFCDDLQTAKGEPWLTNVLYGMYHINAAWKARGSGLAFTVTPDGARKFDQELTQARTCLEKAYSVEPKYPEPAAEMVTVSMGQSPGDMRKWFERAVGAQFDFRKAYLTYITGMLPRWHGSHEALLDFANECVATQRYDTEVPAHLTRILEDINNDLNGDWSVWRRPGVFESVQDVLTHYGDSLPNETNKLYHYSELAGIAWQLQRYEIGRAALEKTNGKPNVAGFNTARTIAPRAISGLYAFTGTDAQKYLQIEQDASAGRFEAAISSLKGIVSQIAPKSASEVWARGRLQELAWKKDFENGQTVSLIPQGSDLSGWYVQNGEFTAKDNSIIGTTVTNGARLVCGVAFGPRWELTATIELLASSDDAKIPSTASAGPFFAAPGFAEYCGVLLRPGAQQAILHRNGAPDFVSQRTLRSTTDITIRQWDENAQILFGDTVYSKYGKISETALQPNNTLGFYSLGAPAGTKFKISGVKIHKLMNEPAH